ncbi:MAG: EthD family reductase [Chloroflexi bacterium]|nr:EthD family reductase [Chloroflexota bacterium]MCY4247577.1 EthD family reductase [Chloroflexota bacterium]
MVKFIIVFRHPEDAEAFEHVYQDFLGLVERMPHIQRRQVAHITGSPLGKPDAYRILELYFASTADQQNAMLSDIGQEAGRELQRLKRGSYDLYFADVYEEAGAPTDSPQAEAESSDG